MAPVCIEPDGWASRQATRISGSPTSTSPYYYPPCFNQVLPKLPIPPEEFSHDHTSNPYRVTTSTLGPPVASLTFRSRIALHCSRSLVCCWLPRHRRPRFPCVPSLSAGCCPVFPHSTTVERGKLTIPAARLKPAQPSSLSAGMSCSLLLDADHGAVPGRLWAVVPAQEAASSHCVLAGGHGTTIVPFPPPPQSFQRPRNT